MAEHDAEDIAHQRGTRLNQSHASELISLFGGSHASLEYLRASDLIHINMAFVVMLHDQSIITHMDAIKILSAINKLESLGVPEAIEIDSRVGDLSTHIEAYIIQETGIEAGGKIHTGRSRNDLYPTMSRLMVRRSLLDVYDSLIRLNETFLSLAGKYSNTIMPGYTQHSQHAQPITLGFYLLGNFDVFERSILRIKDYWRRLNVCPMGAAALATTRFPLDRRKVSSLLGFDHYQEHAYDAISSRDFILEYLFILSTISSDIGRIAENLLYWNTLEFGMISLADQYTSFSTIMPQKKNPVALETLRAMNSVISGKLFNAYGILKAMPWGNGRENTILDDDSVETGSQVKNMILLLKGVLGTMSVNSQRMFDLTNKGFSVATDLADTLVSEYELPFRTAHEIVGLVVKEAIGKGIGPTGITSDMVEQCIKDYLGVKLSIERKHISAAIDPRESVRIRNLPGGTSHRQVSLMKRSREKVLKKDESALMVYRKKIGDAGDNLHLMVNTILKG